MTFEGGEVVRVFVRCPTCKVLDLYHATVIGNEQQRGLVKFVKVRLWNPHHQFGGPGPFGTPRMPPCPVVLTEVALNVDQIRDEPDPISLLGRITDHG